MFKQVYDFFLGSKYHIANATKEKVFVKSDDDRVDIKQISADIGVEGKGKVAGSVILEHTYLERGFFKLKSMDFIEVTKRIITIFTERGELVAGNYEVPIDRSVIVTADNTIVLSKYGFLWKDEKGNYHGRYVCKRCGKKSCSCPPAP